MFEDWKQQILSYVVKSIDKAPFKAISGVLNSYIEELCEYYVAILLENGLIDEHGYETDADFDEDDLLDAMLERFLAQHPADNDEQELLYATLIDQFLIQVEEASEDM